MNTLKVTIVPLLLREIVQDGISRYKDTCALEVLPKSRRLNFHELCKMLGILNFREFF